jgi:hypothetical protein
MTTKVYELYPCWGSFSVKTVDHHGTAYLVAATSVRQAYAVAHKRVWINPQDTHPVGIVLIYTRDKGPTLWCGCSGHSVTGGQPGHGAGICALRAAIESHNGHCPHRRLPLADRLRRHAEQAKRQEVTE